MPPVSFYTPLETPENHRFSDVFRGYRKRLYKLGETFPVVMLRSRTNCTIFRRHVSKLCHKSTQKNRCYESAASCSVSLKMLW